MDLQSNYHRVGVPVIASIGYWSWMDQEDLQAMEQWSPPPYLQNKFQTP